MYTWFSVKVKFDRQGEDGLMTKITEPFLIDAMTFTEAENRILAEVKHYSTTGEIEIADIRKTKISELFDNDSEDADKWYRCKVNYLALDEKKGIEKKTAQIMMVKAANFKNAVDTLIERMRGTLGDYEIATIAETNILDVLKFIQPNEEEAK